MTVGPATLGALSRPAHALEDRLSDENMKVSYSRRPS